MSINSQVENGSQDSGNSQAKPSAEGEGVNHGITSETKGLSFLFALFFVCKSVFSLFRDHIVYVGREGTMSIFFLKI